MPGLPDLSGLPGLIGVDIGASGARAVIVRRTGPNLVAGDEVTVDFRVIPGFVPTPIAMQLDELAGGAGPLPGPAEREQAELWLDAIGEAVCRLAGRSKHGRIVLGLCVPGRKSEDGRGVVAARHGPRIPGLLDALELRLAASARERFEPVSRLSSDGIAAAWGEELGEGGALAGHGSGLLLAAGTGVAQALKLGGRVLPEDEAARLLRAPWELRAGDGTPVEDVVSMGGINRAFERRLPRETAQGGARVERVAAEGSQAACEVLVTAAEGLAELALQQIAALHACALVPGARIERLVLAQHSARLFCEPELVGCFRAPLEKRLVAGLRSLQDALRCAGYTQGDRLAADWLVPSRLRRAPAIGAVALASEGRPRVDGERSRRAP